MPFGLKNTRATYQRVVDKAFQEQIGRNLEVYVDDLVIKSRTEHEIMRDIEERFKTLREINMKLNPKKCTFGIEEGMFLGYKVNTKGIKQKVTAILQNLEKCIKKSDFQWTANAEVAFKQIKKLIAGLPTLTAPMEKEELIVYLAIAREAPIKQVPSKPEITGRMQKWSIKLGEYNIQYRPRTSAKGQILADFIMEHLEEDSLVTTTEVEEEPSELWTLFMDGSSCVDGSGAANQVNGSYIAKEADMIQYLEKVKALASSFKKFSIKQVPRSENKKADALSKIASASFAHLTKQVLVEELKEKSINEAEVLAVMEEERDTWMTPIYNYLTKETPPTKKEKARGVRRKSRRYAVINRVLYKKSYLGPWLRDNPFKDWCEKLCICQHFASVKHLQANDLVERENRSLGEGIKARLDERSNDWIEEIPHNGSIIPAEIRMPTLRTAKIDMVQNDEALEINLDLLEERREQAAIREARSKTKMEKYYNSKVRNTSFKPGDHVYRNNDASHAKDSGKLSPKWEGPYEVTEALGKGAYQLRDRNGKLLPRT
ncbi:reverse transcriptase domain-containing protein [Tanacetum coccineum]